MLVRSFFSSVGVLQKLLDDSSGVKVVGSRTYSLPSMSTVLPSNTGSEEYKSGTDSDKDGGPFTGPDVVGVRAVSPQESSLDLAIDVGRDNAAASPAPPHAPTPQSPSHGNGSGNGSGSGSGSGRASSGLVRPLSAPPPKSPAIIAAKGQSDTGFVAYVGR